jgi:hypothetical protein
MNAVAKPGTGNDYAIAGFCYCVHVNLSNDR